MPAYSPYKIEKTLLTIITDLSTAGIRLWERRADLTEEGRRKEWERITAPYARKITTAAAEVEGLADAVGKVLDFERAKHLPNTIPNAAEESRLSRYLGRGKAMDTQDWYKVIGENLGTAFATALVEELTTRNILAPELVEAILSQYAEGYEELRQLARDMPTALGQLRGLIRAANEAMAPTNINGAPLDSHTRPAAWHVSLESLGIEDFTVTEIGRVGRRPGPARAIQFN